MVVPRRHKEWQCRLKPFDRGSLCCSSLLRHEFGALIECPLGCNMALINFCGDALRKDFYFVTPCSLAAARRTYLDTVIACDGGNYENRFRSPIVIRTIAFRDLFAIGRENGSDQIDALLY